MQKFTQTTYLVIFGFHSFCQGVSSGQKKYRYNKKKQALEFYQQALEAYRYWHWKESDTDDDEQLYPSHNLICSIVGYGFVTSKPQLFRVTENCEQIC